MFPIRLLPSSVDVCLYFSSYQATLLYTVNVLFSRLLKYVSRFGSAYSVICRDMQSSLPLPLRFLPFVLPEGILPMRYDAICYDVLRRYYDDLRRATGVFMGSRASMSSKDDALTLSLILFHIGERSFPSPRQIRYTCSLFLYNDT